MKPPAPCPHIDLLTVVKAKFSFLSNKLQHVSEQLGIGSKTQHEGFGLWVKCAEGDEKAWKTMTRYNKQDVLLLEKLYMKLQGWIPRHPSMSLLTESCVCVNCGSKKLQRRGTAVTSVGKYARLQCTSCGKWQRERINEVDKDAKANILVGI